MSYSGYRIYCLPLLSSPSVSVGDLLLLLPFRLFATLPKQCGSISQKGEKDKPSAGLILKGLFRFFFLLKF